jgi:hypothetical protein
MRGIQFRIAAEGDIEFCLVATPDGRSDAGWMR